MQFNLTLRDPLKYWANMSKLSFHTLDITILRIGTFKVLSETAAFRTVIKKQGRGVSKDDSADMQ